MTGHVVWVLSLRVRLGLAWTHGLARCPTSAVTMVTLDARMGVWTAEARKQAGLGSGARLRASGGEGARMAGWQLGFLESHGSEAPEELSRSQ